MTLDELDQKRQEVTQSFDNRHNVEKYLKMKQAFEVYASQASANVIALKVRDVALYLLGHPDMTARTVSRMLAEVQGMRAQEVSNIIDYLSDFDTDFIPF